MSESCLKHLHTALQAGKYSDVSGSTPSRKQNETSPKASPCLPASRATVHYRRLSIHLQTDWSFTDNNAVPSCKQGNTLLLTARHRSTNTLEFYSIMLNFPLQAMKNLTLHRAKPDVCGLDSFQLQFKTSLQANRLSLSSNRIPLFKGRNLSNSKSLPPCKQIGSFLQLDQNLLSTGRFLSNFKHIPSCKQDDKPSLLDRNLCSQAGISQISNLYPPASRVIRHVNQIESFCQQAGISSTSVLCLPASRLTHYCYRIETSVYRLESFQRQLRTSLQAEKTVLLLDQIHLSTGRNLSNNDSAPSCKQDCTSSASDRNLCPQAGISSTVTQYIPASRTARHRCRIETQCPQTGILLLANQFFPASRV
jgi:hypothetical protein